MTNDFARVTEDLVRLTEADCAIVLIGSAARGCRTEESDIDILFISTEKIANIPLISGYHIKFATEADLLSRLAAGEDFEAWCVRYGIALLDRGVWERVKTPSKHVWPRWETKVVHGTRRLFLASKLSNMGDRPAAREELVFVLGHIARGLLLKKGVFPLSRPELAAQVKGIGYSHLAALHERLRTTNSPSSRDIGLGLRYSKKLLIHLDRTIYRNLSEDHRRAARTKQAKQQALERARVNGATAKNPP